MACACTRRKRGARGHARRLVSGGVGEIAPPVAGRGSSTRGGVSPAPSGCSSAVRCSVETSVGCSSGEGAAWWQPATDGGRAGWGVYPRAKPAPRWHGCHRPRPVAWWQALDAKRRRLPHWGCEMRRRAHPARKEPATRRPVRWPTRCRCGKRAAATVPGRMRAAATKQQRLATHARPATRAPGGISAQRRVAGRCRSRYGVRMHAPRVRARGRVVWQPSKRSGGGCRGWASPRKPRRRQEDGRASRASRPADCRMRGARNLEPERSPKGAAGLRRHPLPPEQPPSSE